MYKWFWKCEDNVNIVTLFGNMWCGVEDKKKCPSFLIINHCILLRNDN
jgi:hypothetical protein